MQTTEKSDRMHTLQLYLAQYNTQHFFIQHSTLFKSLYLT